MQAAVMTRFGADLDIVDIGIGGIEPEEVLVRITDSGICHSDRSAQLGGQDRPLPLVLGHEAAGVVEQVGSDVRMFTPGDHVVGTASAHCGVCRWCLQGLTQHCADKGNARADGSPRLRADGDDLHSFVGLGGFATHMLVSQRALVRLPEEMPLDKAALLGCAVLTGLGAVRNRARVRPGDTVAVIGCGGVGLNVVQGARISGASRIVAVDLSAAKLERARQFGATDIVDASTTEPVAAVQDLLGGVEHCFEVVGAGRAVEQAFAMTRTRGTTTVVGVARPTESIELSPLAFMATEKRLQGSRMGSGNFRVDVPLYGEMYLRGQLMLDELISEVVTLDDVNRGLRALDGSDGARSVIHLG